MKFSLYPKLSNDRIHPRIFGIANEQVMESKTGDFSSKKSKSLERNMPFRLSLEGRIAVVAVVTLLKASSQLFPLTFLQ